MNYASHAVPPGCNAGTQSYTLLADANLMALRSQNVKTAPRTTAASTAVHALPTAHAHTGQRGLGAVPVSAGKRFRFAFSALQGVFPVSAAGRCPAVDPLPRVPWAGGRDHALALVEYL